jgi:arabinogalactan oligomer/maltooligosaccharide transport system permease protein
VQRPSHRIRFLVGLALGAALGVGISWGLLRSARRDAALEGARRRAVVSLLALSDLAGRAWGNPQAMERALGGWQEANFGSAARVVALQGARIEASTLPADRGDKAAPRRLARDEKPTFDRAQRLRAAVAANREGGAAKEEIEIEGAPGGALALAAPVESGGQVAGMAEMVTGPLPAPTAPAALPALLALLLPILALALLCLLLKERRLWLAVASVLCLGAGLVAYADHSLGTLDQDRRAAQGEVAAHLERQAAQVRRMAADLKLGEVAAAEAYRWDADPQRKPLGLLSGDPATDEASLQAHLSATGREARRSLWASAALAVALLLFVGLGGAARVGRALVANKQAYLYVLPAMVGMVVLVFFPFFYGIAISFTDQNIYNTSRPLLDIWVGLRNYGDILGDFSVARRATDGSLVFNYLNFYWTLLFTIIWTVCNVAYGVTVGLVLALILNREMALRPIYRVLLILPWAVPNYITALVWKGMFHQQFGVVNQMVQLLGGQPISWFDKPLTSFLTAWATNGWLSFPFMMVVSLGALQSIPAELYEAARVDGANRWQQFRAITLPSLKPALVPAVILSVIWTFNMFNIIYLVTAGEPGSATEILITQAYKFAFERYRYGYAAAYSTVIFGILLLYGAIQNRVSRATEAA